eukprot:GHRR01003109.1.p1 GENE.GHRR01003109.1~~GHRR01003109.1.p1  ORF type:complete len:345 (+),score=94.33 GHRR01003109.1:315-1349(+)
MAQATDAAVEGLAGAIGAIIALTSTYPLLTVSTLRALEAGDDVNGKGQLQGGLRLVPAPIRDVCIYAREHSWRALFAGLKPAVAATAASQGVYHTVYSALRRMAVTHKLRGARQAHATGQHSVSGGKSIGISVGASMVVASVAGVVNVLLTNPIWVVITQLQAIARHKPDISTLAVVRQIYREDGIAGFFKGLMPSVVMVVNPTIQYILYESLVARLLELRSKARRYSHSNAKQRQHTGMALGPLEIFALSALAKVGATLVTYPMLVVKNRLQAMNSQTQEEMQYSGVCDAVKRMLADEGVSAFYKGMQVKMLQTVLAAALLMMLKEEIVTAVQQVVLPKQPRR